MGIVTGILFGFLLLLEPERMLRILTAVFPPLSREFVHLYRAYVVLRACAIRSLVEHSEALLRIGWVLAIC